jgi:hypothetical protein
MPPHQPSDWKYLAEQASVEMDPEKFMTLIQELNRVLTEREEMVICQQRRGNRSASFDAAV